ncbi:MAG: AAA family ATPase, partial [Myxococcota bacterium]
GLSDVRRPFGVFLFAGPTGVGKTHLAQVLADFLFSSPDRMVRFNMADYPDESNALRLFGDANAYGMAAKRGLMAQRLSGHPFAVLLLDEFEKAHRAVHDRFLQLFDEGWFVNGLGESISCRSLVIIATSNAGAEVYREQALGFISAPPPDELQAEVERRIHRAFRFEFLNRFDELVHFRPLNREVIRAIAIRELQQLKVRSGLRQRELALDVDEGVLDWLTVHGYDPHYGARFLRRTIQRTVATAVAEAIVKSQPKPGTTIWVSIRGGRVVAESPKTVARPRRASVRLPLGTDAVTRQLDRSGLLAQIARFVAEARARLLALDRAREQAAGLLERMNAANFWGSPDEGRVVDSYRALDVRIRSFERISEPLIDLVEREDIAEASVDTLAKLVERSGEALAAWAEREADEGATEIWLVLRGASALDADAGLVADLVDIELAWCRSVGLSGRVAAYALRDERPSLVVLDVEGPAAEAYLQMEEGLHRRRAADQADERIRVDVVVQGPRPIREPLGIRAVRQQTLALGVEVAYRARIGLKTRALRLELLGPERGLLAHVVHDLAASWDVPTGAPPSVVRVYREDGQGARDPRTGGLVASYKDVQRGRLDPLLEAWRRWRTVAVS